MWQPVIAGRLCRCASAMSRLAFVVRDDGKFLLPFGEGPSVLRSYHRREAGGLMPFVKTYLGNLIHGFVFELNHSSSSIINPMSPTYVYG